MFLVIGTLISLSSSITKQKETLQRLEQATPKVLRKVIRNLKYLPKVAGLEKDWMLNVLTLYGQLLWTYSVYIIASSLEVNLSFLAILYAVLLTELSRLIPISAQGLGVREVVFAYTLTGFGYHRTDMFTASAISYTILGIMQCLNWVLGSMLNSHLNYREQ